MDASAVPFNDLFRNVQPQSGADFFLGGEEWFEDSLQMFRSDTGPIVLDTELHHFPAIALDARYVDLQRSIRVHGVDRIGDEVGDHLSQLTCPGMQRRTSRELPADNDPFAGDFIRVEFE